MQPTGEGRELHRAAFSEHHAAFTHQAARLTTTTEVVVSAEDDAEARRVTLTNTGRVEKQVSLFSFLEFCLWDAVDDCTNFQRNFSIGEVEVDGSAIYHKTEYRERRDHYAFYSVNAPLAGFDTDRETFVGLYNGLHEPQPVLAGACRNSVASGWSHRQPSARRHAGAGREPRIRLRAGLCREPG